MQVLDNDIREFVQHFELKNELRDSKILVTGATGLIGSIMVKCLIQMEAEFHLGMKIVAMVRCIDKAQRVFGNRYRALEYDVRTLGADSSLEGLPEDIDYIVHGASPTDSTYFIEHPVETFETGVEGTRSLLKYAKDHKVKGFVFLSSMEMYGQVLDDKEFVTEEKQGYINPLQVRSSYPMVKRASECLCHAYAHEYSVNVSIARLAQTFGAGVSTEDNRVFAQFAKSALHGNNIVLHTTGGSKRCYCYTTDAVSGLLYILLKGTKGEAYNVANEDTYCSIKEMAEMVCKELNPNIEVVYSLDDNGKNKYPPEHKLKLSSKKLRSMGWQPVYNLLEMYRKLVCYLKEAGV